MPGFDKTGPMGSGAMTGGGRGLCNRRQEFSPGNAGGFGYGRGRACRRSAGFGSDPGRGMGRFSNLPPTETVGGDPDQASGEVQVLQSQIEQLGQTLSTLQQRITELESNT